MNQSELSSVFSSVAKQKGFMYISYMFIYCVVCALSRFNNILVSRSFAQLKATFDEYSKVGVVILVMRYIRAYSAFSILNFFVFQISKYDIEESIKREMSGDLRDGMASIGKN